jgi:hypothetical protein
MDDWHCLMLVTQDSHIPTAREDRTWIHALRAAFLNLLICRWQVASVLVCFEFVRSLLTEHGRVYYESGNLVASQASVGALLSIYIQNLCVKINNFLFNIICCRF